MSKKVIKYFYDKVEVLKVVDGDTVDVNIDLGFDIQKKVRLRLYGINAPETKGIERPQGLISKNYLIDFLPVGTIISIDSLGLDKYGRSLAVLYKEDTNINQHMINEGYAVEYLL